MMPTLSAPASTQWIATSDLSPSPFSLSVYGDPDSEIADLLESIREQGILVPVVVVAVGEGWEIVSGHRRWACAKRLGHEEIPAEIREIDSIADRRRAVLEYNRQRRKRFSQLMREADALESLLGGEAARRRNANLRRGFAEEIADRRNSDDRTGRTDERIAKTLNIGGKDVYRQARSIWKAAISGDSRAISGVGQLDAETKSIHAAYKDLRRRDRYTAGFRPTPYDVWPFKHDRAFGIPHPGSIPPGIVAHLLHYYTQPGDLVVDPMAGGGTTLDVCESMGRRCLVFDIAPVRPEIQEWDVRQGFTSESKNCDLIFCDPPYHTMLARHYKAEGIADVPLTSWIAFLQQLAINAFETLRSGGHFALLLANQTEKDLPAGVGYLDHAFLGYGAAVSAGFTPQRRVSCPMDGAYLPQHVQKARAEGRMLGQVRDLLIMRKP